ncbi:reverse transcriptase domain-containing protein [Tanacetum coccineum]
MILESIEHGLLIWPTIEENGVTRTKKYSKLSAIEKIQDDCDLRATHIIIQGLPSDIYSLVNHHRVANDLWKKVQLLMQAPFYFSKNHTGLCPTLVDDCQHQWKRISDKTAKNQAKIDKTEHEMEEHEKDKANQSPKSKKSKSSQPESQRSNKADVPNSAIKLMLFPFSLAGATRRWLEKEPPRSILTWEDLVSKFINGYILTWEDLVSKFINEFFPPSRTTNLRNEISNFEQNFDESFHEAWDRYKDLLRACPHHGFTELHQLDTFYNALNLTDQDSLNSAAGVKSSDGNSSSSDIAKLTHAVNQRTSAVTTAMTTILKQFQATPPPASIKAIEEVCVMCGGAHPYYQCLAADGNTFPEYRDNIQGYVSAAAVNYNQGNSGYRPPSVANQIRPPGFAQPNVQNNQNRFSQPQGYNRGNNFNQDTSYQAPIQQNQVVPLSELEKIKKINDVNIKAMQAQINNVKNELRNEMQTSIQASMSNQTIASTSGSGSLPSNTFANSRGELKAITTRSGLVLDGPSVPMPPPFINPKEDERVEETLTDSELAEYTIKVPPPLVQKAKPPSQRNYVVHQRDPRHPHIPYPSRMNQEKRQEKDEV